MMASSVMMVSSNSSLSPFPLLCIPPTKSSTSFTPLPSLHQLGVVGYNNNNSNNKERIRRIRRGRERGISVVTRAGPSTSSYIFAFVFPLSLLAVTIFASIRVADKLDQKFLEEVAASQSISDGSEDDSDVPNSSEEEELAPPRSRNRPKRLVEPSSST